MLNIAEQAWQLTGWRPDLPDVARIDAMREAARILCREGLCLRETIVFNQAAKDPFVRPFASDTPKTRECLRVMGLAVKDKVLEPSDPGHITMSQFPQQLAVGEPTSYIPLYDGTAMLNLRPEKETKLYALVASCPVGNFFEVDLPENMLDAVLSGARYILMSRPGKGQDMRLAGELRYQFGAYIQGLRATASMGLTPQDWKVLIQAPLRAVMEADGGDDNGGDPGGDTGECTLITNGTTGFTGQLIFDCFAFNTFRWSFEFVEHAYLPKAIRVVVSVKRDGVVSEQSLDLTPDEYAIEGGKLVCPASGLMNLGTWAGDQFHPAGPFNFDETVSVEAYVSDRDWLSAEPHTFPATPSLRRCVKLESPVNLNVSIESSQHYAGSNSYGEISVGFSAAAGMRTEDFAFVPQLNSGEVVRRGAFNYIRLTGEKIVRDLKDHTTVGSDPAWQLYSGTIGFLLIPYQKVPWWSSLTPKWETTYAPAYRVKIHHPDLRIETEIVWTTLDAFKSSTRDEFEKSGSGGGGIV